MKKEIKLNALSKVYDNMYDYYTAEIDELKTLLDGETNTKRIKIIETYIDIYTALKNDLFIELSKIKERLWVRLAPDTSAENFCTCVSAKLIKNSIKEG